MDGGKPASEWGGVRRERRRNGWLLGLQQGKVPLKVQRPPRARHSLAGEPVALQASGSRAADLSATTLFDLSLTVLTCFDL
jgi:hypothetical protein